MVFLCDLCALCGENAFDPSLESRRQRRSYGWVCHKERGRAWIPGAASLFGLVRASRGVFASLTPSGPPCGRYSSYGGFVEGLILRLIYQGLVHRQGQQGADDAGEQVDGDRQQAEFGGQAQGYQGGEGGAE